MRAALFLWVLCVQGTGYVSPAAAQNTAGEVAYVESVNGRALAMVQGKPTLLDSLDVIDEKTRIDLLASSELRLCHYRTQRIFTLTGPLRASVTDAGVAGEKGNAIAPSAETCVRPVMSNFQGGIIARTTGIPSTKVALQPAIKIVDRSQNGIRNIALWDSAQRTIVASFEKNTARPTLDDGRSYLLVVGRNDGSELKMMLQATRSNNTRPLILTIR
jgi:hypothetical protein